MEFVTGDSIAIIAMVIGFTVFCYKNRTNEEETTPL